MYNEIHYWLTLIRIWKKTCVFEYAGSARTPKAYWYDMKAMHSLIIAICAALKFYGVHTDPVYSYEG